MSDLLRKLDDIPVTLVIAIAYGTLLVVCDPYRPEQFRERLEAYGMLSGAACTHGGAWRLLASAFLHGNIVHLLFNLSMLMGIGPVLERTLGSTRFLTLYLLAAAGGGVTTCVLSTQSVVGGSGALFGLLGATIAINMRAGRHLLAFLELDGPRRLLGMVALNLAIGYLLPYISNTCHIGGLLTGFAFAFLWLRPGEPSAARTRWRAATAALFLGALFASLQPVTRHDWLRREAQRTMHAERRGQLLEAEAAARR